jgi:predicted transcriptional regulator
MNDNHDKSLHSYRSLLLLSEIGGEEPLSQRELSRRLGIAVGLVNSYLKNLIAKGCVRIASFPRNRYSYLLTPQGMAEKSRLAYQHLSYFTNLYTVARQDYLGIFRSLEAKGIHEVAFCGVDEVAEIAYLSLKETEIVLSAVMDDMKSGGDFFGNEIVSMASGVAKGILPIVITSFKRDTAMREALLLLGVTGNSIISAVDTGKS